MSSATYSDDIHCAAQDFLNDYLFLNVGMVGGASSDVDYKFHPVAKFYTRDKSEVMQDPATRSEGR